MAATGGMRTARRAGLMAETTVTPTPTSQGDDHRPGLEHERARGRVMPNPLSSASSPTAASTPSPMPTSEETTPTMAASPSTERNTWRRLAPTMRSRASSRVRWPTVIEKVLKMVNAPTNREMKAKTSSAVEKNDSAWLMALVCSLATVWPVTTSTPGGRARAMARLDGGLVGSRLRHDVDGVELAHLAEDLLGGGKVEGGEGGPGQVVGGAELDDPGDGERLRRPGEAGSGRVCPP